MYNKNSLIGFFTALVLCILSVLYFKFFLEKKDNFLLDNPTSQSVRIFLNKSEYFLAPGQSVEVEVKKGKNSISAVSENGTKMLQDTFFSVENLRRGLINPTQSYYYTFKRYYGNVKNLDSLYKSHKIKIDGKEFVGDIKATKELLVQDFYFNIDEDFPRLINKVDTIEARVKLFRKNQFLEFYQLNYE